MLCQLISLCLKTLNYGRIRPAVARTLLMHINYPPPLTSLSINCFSFVFHHYAFILGAWIVCFGVFLTCAHANGVASLDNILMESFSQSEAAILKVQALRL